jgi:hypothetical protein
MVEEPPPDRGADALEAVGVGRPVLALVTIPGIGLLGVGGLDGGRLHAELLPEHIRRTG